MASNFGLKVGVEGEKKFKQALREIDQSLKTAASEAKLVASQYDATDKSAEALTARNQALAKEVAANTEKMKVLSEALENAKETFGENSKEAQTWQQKLNETQATINGLNREIDKNEDALWAMATAEDGASEAAEDLAETTEDAGEEAEKSGPKFEGLGKVAAAVGATMAAAAVAIGKAIMDVGKALADMSVQGAKYADDVNTAAKVTGLSTEKLQEYMYAADLVDVSLDTLSSTLTKTISGMKAAKTGTGDVAEAYKKLGVKVKDSHRQLRDSEDVFLDLIDALGKIENETERDALAMTVFGKSAKDLNPLIASGSEALKEYAAQAHEAGYVLEQETLDAFNELNDGLTRLGTGASAAKNALGTILLPVLNDLAGEGVDLLGEFSRGILGADGDISKMADVLDSVLPKALDVVAKYIPVVVEIAGSIVSALAGALLDNAPAVLDALGDVLDRLIDFVADNIPAILQTVIGVLQKVVAGVIENLPVVLRALETMVPVLLDGIQSLVSALGKALVDNLPTIVKAVNSVVLTLVQQLASRLPDFVRTVLEIVTGVVSALLEAAPEIIKTIGETIPMVVSAILDCLPLIIDAVIQIVEAVARNLPAIIDAIVEIIPDVIEQVIQAVIRCLPAIIKGIISLVKAIAQNLPSILLSIVQAIPKLIGNVIDAILECLPQLIDCVIMLVEEIIKNLPEIIVRLLEKIPDLVSSIVGGIISCVGKFVEAGGKLLEGVWEGIKGAAGWLWEQISGFFGGIVDDIVALFTGGKMKGLGKGIAEDLNEGYDSYLDSKAPETASGPTMNIYDTAQVGATVNGIYPASADYAARQNLTGAGGRYERMDEVIDILGIIANNPVVVAIGDDQIGVANNTYESRRGAVVQEGAYANAS